MKKQVAALKKKRSVGITKNGGSHNAALGDAQILLKLIAQSEDARRKKRWLTQEQMEAELRKRFGD
jgi:hypothetical protein